VIDVLEGLSPPLDVRGLAIARLGAGVQADLFVVRAPGRRLLWQEHAELVVKLYRSSDADIDEVARDEFESLCRLHARLDDHHFGVWTIRTPAPVLCSRRPPGLVMTMVPGRSLNSHLTAPAGSVAGDLDPLACAIGHALWRYWNDEVRIYGDLDLNNILCDLDAGVLSLVDPGMPEKAYLCEGVKRAWYPASRDLAYLVFDVATAQRYWFGLLPARKRREELVERILRACLQTIDSAAERAALLDEVARCARVHLRRIKAGWSPVGLWHVLLRRIAARHIDRTLRGLQTDAGGNGRAPLAGCMAPGSLEGHGG
jgi:hypothetical protein